MLKAMILKHQYIYLDSYIVLQELFFVAVQILIERGVINSSPMLPVP